MPDIDEGPRSGGPQEDWVASDSGYVEEIPGHTPGVAEGDDEDAPHRAHPFPDPDKTPGRAEG
ncbi:hypothetical protein [Myxococcus stipitatus]|uniref:hypothetical protein n=1 Tax=Myxococcus stipitatus TaxID=83455 RepID=UPI0030CB4B41